MTLKDTLHKIHRVYPRATPEQITLLRVRFLMLGNDIGNIVASYIHDDLTESSFWHYMNRLDEGAYD